MIEPAEYIEIGMWLELNRGLIERAGCEWRGAPEHTWEYYSHIDFACGYTPDERKRIIDIAMEDFKRVFSDYPKTVGSWIIDAVSLDYMAKKYGVVASLNCKEQWLTDGYSLWGGYYNQAYYPCKNNMLSPAQSVEEQIPIPVFRMLGSDPVRQYDCAIHGSNGQGVITLEPYLHPSMDPNFGGSNENWTRWFFEEMCSHESLTFGYAQAGQENPFVWDGQSKGYTMQMRLFKELSEKGLITDAEKTIFAAFQYSSGSCITVYLSMGIALFPYLSVSHLVPLGVILFYKIVGMNLMRLYLHMVTRKEAA